MTFVTILCILVSCTDVVLLDAAVEIYNDKPFTDYYQFHHDRNTRNLLSTNDTEWVSVAQPQLPRRNWCSSAFSYNDSIYFYGGAWDKQQSVEYNIIENTIIDHGDAAMPMPIFGCAQFYTQRAHLFYWIDQTQMGPYGNQQSFIVVYNIKSKQFEPNITITNRMNTRFGCLASNNDTLAVLDANLYIYNISTELWMTNIPSLQESRKQFACCIHPLVNELYALSGIDTTTVERISLNNVSSHIWEYIEDGLSVPMTNSRAVVYKHFIMLIAGAWNSPLQSNSETFIINCLTGKITNGSHLAYATRATATILINQVIYVWGGAPSIYTWQYLNLSKVNFLTTLSPTIEPTIEPTTEPTIEPTIHTMQPTPPTIEPTFELQTIDTAADDVVLSTFYESEDDNHREKNEKRLWIYVIVIGCVLLILILVLCIICIKKRSHLWNGHHSVARDKGTTNMNLTTHQAMELQTMKNDDDFVE